MSFNAAVERVCPFAAVIAIITALAGCGGVTVSSDSAGSGSAAPPPAVGSSSSSGTTSTGSSAVALSATAYTVAPSSNAVVTINRSGSLSGPATVSYTTLDGTATAGADYTATSGSVSWNAGESDAKTVKVPVTSAASGMNFAFALTSIAGDADFGTPASAVVQVESAGATASSASSSSSGSSGSSSSSSSGSSSGASSGSSSGSSSSGSSGGSSGTSSAATATANVFPKIGVQAISGSQFFAPVNDKQLAQYGLIIIGGNYAAWPQVQGRTRDQIVVSLKSQTHTGRNALTPIIFQYENALEMNQAVPWLPEWTAAVSRNNWFLYQSGAGGAKAQSVFNSSFVMANPAHVVGTDPATGLHPFGLLANLLYQRYYLGTGSGGAAMASTHLDGYFVDLLTQQNVTGSAADWERNGTNPDRTDPVATAAVTLGKADYPNQLAMLNSRIIAGGNSNFGYDMSPTSTGGLGMTFSYLSGQLGMAMEQFEWATAGGETNVLDFNGFSGAMTWYETLENNTKPGGYALMTGGVLPNDYKLVRYSLGLTLMRNGWAIYASNAAAGDLVSDVVDPSSLSTYPVFDEFWGGTVNTAGYLGAASGDGQGTEQSGPWLQGVWRRDFVNGIVLVNPANNGTQTVSLGGTFWHLSGSQAPGINNGAAASSVTIAPGDGLILLRNPPPT